MDSDKPLSVRVPKFKGTPEGWPAWRDTMEAIMGACKLINAINNPRPVDAPVIVGNQAAGGLTPAEVWDEQSAKIYMYLLLYSEDQAQAVVSQFRGTRSGVAAWQALLERYDHQGILGRSLLQRQLMETRFEASADPAVYFLAIERVTTRLGELGQPVSDEALVGLVLSQLPEPYGPLTTIFDTMEVLSYDAIKQRVRTFYKRRIAKLDGSEDGAEDFTKAFMAGGGRQQRKDQDWKSRVRCFHCQKLGHVKRECPSTKKSLDDSGGANGSSNKAGAWKGFKQQGKDTGRVRFDLQRTAGVADIEDSDDEESDGERVQSAFSATSSSSKGSFWIDDDKGTVLTFIIDSGASCHMIHDSRYLSNIRHVDKLVNVCGGRTLMSIGIGEIEVLAKDTKGKAWPIVIRDILIVPRPGNKSPIGRQTNAERC